MTVMRGYDDRSYGDAFADVYDEWYADVTDVGATVALLIGLAGTGPVLELGTGTGRLAIPLAESGLEVHGIDASAAMLERLTAKPGGDAVHVHLGDMVDDLPPGPFSLAIAAYNTLFNLRSAQRQHAAFAAVAARLRDGGRFAVEAFVPDEHQRAGGTVSVRSLSVDRVVLSIDVHDPGGQRVDGQLVELTERDGVRLRPWSIRYASPEELDAMAASCGLTLEHRWEDAAGTAFTPDSARHLSIYRVAPVRDVDVTDRARTGPAPGPILGPP
jgi:SAM-dependent methyltransferase